MTENELRKAVVAQATKCRRDLREAQQVPMKQAEEKMMKLAAAGYDMIYILDEQEWLKEKYTKKTRVD